MRLVLWGTVLVLVAIFLSVADATSAGVSTDLGRVASQLPDAVREFFLTVAQVGGVLVPLVIVGLLVWQRRWRRIGVGLLGAAAGLWSWLRSAPGIGFARRPLLGQHFVRKSSDRKGIRREAARLDCVMNGGWCECQLGVGRSPTGG